MENGYEIRTVIRMYYIDIEIDFPIDSILTYVNKIVINKL